MRFRNMLTATTAALLIALPVSAQMYEGFDRDAGFEGFRTGLDETGRFVASDRDQDGMLNEGEFATGMFADWDTDDEFGISEEEYGMGAARYHGDDYGMTFADFDTDQSGLIDQSEFGANWDTEYYTTWDTDADGLLSNDEYSEGYYNAADRDQDKVITVEEEGFFEGWFDGDDVTAEIEEVGDVL